MGCLALVLLLGLAGCVPVPQPARPEPAPAETGAFSPSARVKVLLLDLAARGVPAEIAERAGQLVTVALEGRRMEVLHETDLQPLWDAGSRARILGKGTDADLGRVARRFGADEVLTGFVGRSGKARVFDLEAVGPRGRVVARAAAVWRGGLTDFYVAVRQAAERMGPIEVPPGPVEAGTLAWAARRHLGFLEHCLADGVLADPALAGEAVVDLTVTPTGRVSGAAIRETTLSDPDVAACLTRMAEALRLPAGVKAPTPVSVKVDLPAEAPKPDTAGLP